MADRAPVLPSSRDRAKSGKMEDDAPEESIRVPSTAPGAATEDSEEHVRTGEVFPPSAPHSTRRLSGSRGQEVITTIPGPRRRGESSVSGRPLAYPMSGGAARYILEPGPGPSMALRAVFFDFGGTLVRAFREHDAYSVYAEVLGKRGRPLDPERWTVATRRVWSRLEPSRYATVGANPSWGDRGSAETLRELGIPDPDREIVTALHDAITSPEWHRPFPESEKTARRIHAEGLGVHVVSNNTDYLPEEIARLGWQSLFDTVTFSQEAGAEKPDRRIFELALHRAGCAPGEVVHVGDTWVADYLGAKRAGLRAIWLNRAGVPPQEPCETVRDLHEVLKLLAR